MCCACRRSGCRPEQIPASLCALADYWCYWHGSKGYSGVGLLVSKQLSPERPEFSHPPFDHESRIAVATVGGIAIASVYVPNGGKDFVAKMHFLEALESYAGAFARVGAPLVLCGDLNVARADIDVHPKERKPAIIGQLPEERALMERILVQGMSDVARELHPDNDQFYTWWAPWRSMRQRNIGWRIDYILVSTQLAKTATGCESLREVGRAITLRSSPPSQQALLPLPLGKLCGSGPVRALAADARNAGSSVHDRAAVGKFDAGLETEIRLSHVSLGKEKVERVRLISGKPKL